MKTLKYRRWSDSLGDFIQTACTDRSTSDFVHLVAQETRSHGGFAVRTEDNILNPKCICIFGNIVVKPTCYSTWYYYIEES